MSGLLYYLPQRSHVELAQAAELGLGHAFERDLSPRGVSANGPDGGAGVVICDATRVAKLGHYADCQEWMKIPQSPADAWVGRFINEPVKPEDLARDEQLGGHPVTLADGQQWLVPVARGLAETDDGQRTWYQAVPTRMRLDEQSGDWTEGEIVERYRPLWSIATAWWDRFYASAEEDFEESFDFARRADAAAEVLAVNYRLGRAEVSLLGLFDAQAPVAVLHATVDMPTMEEWLKKNRADSPAED